MRTKFGTPTHCISFASFITEKQFLTVVAALGAVMQISRQYNACESFHGRECDTQISDLSPEFGESRN